MYRFIIGLLLIGLLGWLALRSLTTPVAPPPVAFAWPAPDEDSIDYLKGIDLRTLLPRQADGVVAGRVDVHGNPLPEGATARLCWSWGTGRLVVSPDGQWLAGGSLACSPRVVEVFDARTGLAARRLGAHRGLIEALAFSRDSHLLAVARSDFSGFRDQVGTITLYDTETFEERGIFGEGTGPRALAFTPAGQLVSGGGDGMVWLWDPATMEPIRRLLNLSRKVVALALSPDGKQLATSSNDDLVHVWNFETAAPILRIRTSAKTLVFSPDGRLLATNLGIWDLDSGTELPRRQLIGTASLAFSPDGRTVARYDSKEIILRELGTGQVRWRTNRQTHEGYRRSIAFLPGGRAVVSGEEWGEGLLWNITGLDGPPPPLRLDELDSLLYQLGSAEGTVAYAAVWRLASANQAVVAPLVNQLKQAAPLPVEPRRLQQLLADLDSPEFAVRERATLELESLGREGEEALRKVLESEPPLEVRARAERILDRIGDRGGKLPHELFRIRAVEVLELQGSAEARQALQELAETGVNQELRDDARRSFERLNRLAATRQGSADDSSSAP